MLTIHKFPLDIEDEQDIVVESGAQPLFAAEQEGVLTIWMLVDTELEVTPRKVYVRGTGHGVPRHKTYVGSVIMNPLVVWHVFIDPLPWGTANFGPLGVIPVCI